MSKPLILSIIIVAFILGLGTGFILSPEYAVKMSDKKSAMVELGHTDRFIDLRYMDGVIAHHKSAIYMAKQAVSSSQRPEIVSLAKDIIASDEKNIAELSSWKKSWYNNSREVTSFEKINLGNYDDKFDLRFLNALIAHHTEAIDVAKEIRTKSRRNEILNLADDIIKNLTKSRESLSAWRLSWYQI